MMNSEYRDLLKAAKHICVMVPEREMTEEYMNECVAKEHRQSVKAFIYIVFLFIGSVWAVLSTIFFLIFGAVGFIPFGIGAFMFGCFFVATYPSFRDSRRSIKTLETSSVITESVTCTMKIHLHGSECLDSEKSDEYYMCCDNRYYELGSNAFELFTEGDKLLLAGVSPEEYVVAFICQKSKEEMDKSTAVLA